MCIRDRRYGHRVENDRFPKTEAARQELAAVIGADGQHLLTLIEAAIDQPWLSAVPAVKILRRVWMEQYVETEGKLRWRTAEERPAPVSYTHLDVYKRQPMGAGLLCDDRRSRRNGDS